MAQRRRAVVTGGGTGIGAATAMRLARDGFDLDLIGRREQPLRGVADEIERAGGVAAVHPVDLTDAEQVTALGHTLGAGPTIDALVLNAGGGAAYDADADLSATRTRWHQVYDQNVLSAVLLAEVLLDHLSRPGARVVVMSSIAGLRGAGAYGAAKAALNAWVMGLSTELAGDQITVNSIAPGYVPDTEFWDGRRTEEINTARLAQIPMGRAGTSDEVAGTVAYLVGPDGAWTTGQIVQVNGGALLGRG